jgi:hypothetical protein
MKKIISYVLALAVGFALGILFQKKPADQKLETTVQTDAQHAAADVKAGAQKAGEVVTNVESEIKNK